MSSSIHPLEIGVVIQGPIQSRGRTLTNLVHKNYDATNDIRSMLNEAFQAGIKPIVVTWDNQDLAAFTSHERKFIKCIPYYTPSLTQKLRNNWNKNSKYRQYYSTLYGVDHLIGQGCVYVIKARTDNYIPLLNLIKFILNLTTNEARNYFYTPLINLDKPHMFYDFYSFSSAVKLRDLCKVILFQKEINSNIHFDVFFRWTKYSINEKVKLRDLLYVYPKYPRFTLDQLKIIRLGLEKVFRPLPKEIWSTLTWRGEQFGTNGMKNDYRFAEQNMVEILQEFDGFTYKVSRFFSVDVPAIFSFFISSRTEDIIRHVIKINKSLLRRLLEFFRKSEL